MKRINLYSFLLLPMSFFFYGCAQGSVEDKTESDQCMANNPEGKYLMNNEYGSGFIFINSDGTYLHEFTTTDSTYIDSSKWKLNFSDVDQQCKISFDDWKWHYPVFPHTKSEESIICVMILFDECLTILVTGRQNGKYDFCKNSAIPIIR